MKNLIISTSLLLLLSCQTKNEPQITLIETGFDESCVFTLAIKAPDESHVIGGHISIFYKDGTKDEWKLDQDTGLSYYLDGMSGIVLTTSFDKAAVIREKGVASIKMTISNESEAKPVISEKPTISITNSDLCDIPEVQVVVKREKSFFQQKQDFYHEQLELNAHNALNF